VKTKLETNNSIKFSYSNDMIFALVERLNNRVKHQLLCLKNIVQTVLVHWSYIFSWSIYK